MLLRVNHLRASILSMLLSMYRPRVPTFPITKVTSSSIFYEYILDMLQRFTTASSLFSGNSFIQVLASLSTPFCYFGLIDS